LSEDIYSQIKKCVTFIGTGEEKDFNSKGTGFFIAVPVEGRESKITGYFVTAKHVIQDNNGQFFLSITLRLNTLVGSLNYSKIDLQNAKIYTHNDQTVDIAVIPLRPKENIIEFKMIPSKMICTKEMISKNEIREGVNVFFAGLFTSYFGQKRNQPIFRFGKLALMTDERIDWREQDKTPISAHLYLAECQSFGGNSGSPVFFEVNAKLKKGEILIGPPIVYLAGIVKGSFLSASEIQQSGSIDKLLSYENVGVSAITPAYKLNEILFRTDIIEARKKTLD